MKYVNTHSRKMLKLLLLITLFYFTGCVTTQNDIEKMRYRCEKQGIMSNFYMYLSFPNPEKIKNVKVNRIKDERIIESFEIKPNSPSIWIDRDFYTHDTYEFIIDGEKPFVLTDVKTRLNFHCPMLFGECDIVCGIDKGKMNGEPYDRVDGIFLQKEGYK